jgi:hypothetical protein
VLHQWVIWKYATSVVVIMPSLQWIRASGDLCSSSSSRGNVRVRLRTHHLVLVAVSGELFKHAECSALLRLRWNIEWFGGLDAVLGRPEVPSGDETLSGCAQELRLLAADLSCLKAAALDRRCLQCLYDIQNASTHQAVLQAINCITGSVM